MYMLYDTRTVHPLDRYEYARAGAAGELAPVAIRGRAPGELLAMLSVAQVGDFAIEAVTWAADSEIEAHRTSRLIKACDPECYRLFLSVNGGVRMEQAGHQTLFGTRDIALYDLSRPWLATHRTGPVPMRLVMLTFPRALVPITRAAVTPLIGAVTPRNLPGRNLIARFLVGLTDDGIAATQQHDGDLAEVLSECVTGLIRQRLGWRSGLTPHTRRLLHMAHLRGIIRRQLGDPAFGPAQIAQAANISPRYLHKLFQGNELTPMQLLKRLRLEGCHRCLLDPAMATTPVGDIMAAHGYLRPDRFARDFKQLFGVSATELRKLGVHRGTP
jgi:AraC-like DNA-binding protein